MATPATRARMSNPIASTGRAGFWSRISATAESDSSGAALVGGGTTPRASRSVEAVLRAETCSPRARAPRAIRRLPLSAASLARVVGADRVCRGQYTRRRSSPGWAGRSASASTVAAAGRPVGLEIERPDHRDLVAVGELGAAVALVPDLD